MQNDLINFINSEMVLTALGIFVAALWTGFKTTEMYRKRTNVVMRLFLQIVEGAVANTYTNYVRQRKAENPDGKLTPDQKKIAVEIAKHKISEVCEIKRIDNTVYAATPEIVEAQIEKAVSRLKTAGRRVSRGKGGLVDSTND